MLEGGDGDGAVGGGGGDGKGAGVDVIGADGVGNAFEFFGSGNGNGVGSQTLDFGPHFSKHLAQIYDMGFAGGVFNGSCLRKGSGKH